MPRGRPLKYADDRLCIEMARRILSGRARGAWAAACQIEAEYQDGCHRAPESMAQRLYRKYKKREQWLLMQAKVRPVVRARRRSVLGAFLDSMRTTQQIVEQHQQVADMVNRMTEQQRLLERMTRAVDQWED
jgi:hypothetical protein